MTAAAILLALVTLGRLGELWLARRNTAALLASGAVEIAPGHYPLIVALHTAWLVALWAVPVGRPTNEWSRRASRLVQSCRQARGSFAALGISRR